MDKKELILTTAKELMIAYKENFALLSKDKGDAAGNHLSSLVKQVEKVYNEIPNNEPPR